jgi:hypothetical protein
LHHPEIASHRMGQLLHHRIRTAFTGPQIESPVVSHTRTRKGRNSGHNPRLITGVDRLSPLSPARRTIFQRFAGTCGGHVTGALPNYVTGSNDPSYEATCQSGYGAVCKANRFAFVLNGHSEKSSESSFFPINRLALISERAGIAARVLSGASGRALPTIRRPFYPGLTMLGCAMRLT